MKITSFNSLFYSYSNGASSFRDQILVCKAQIERENPDVAVFLEMPNPHDTVKSDNIAMLQHLDAFQVWLQKRGYQYQKKLNNMLSVWVCSRLPLIPLLLLGADSIGGAAAKLLRPHGDEFVNRRVDGTSDYVDCAGTVISPNERSVICGVVCPPVDVEEMGEGGKMLKKRVRPVLPLIATHARCLYQNTRFGSLLFSILRAFVARKGVLIGDMNLDVSDGKLQEVQADDARMATELTPGALDAIMNKLPRCPINKKLPVPTCTGISFPFKPLQIDGIYSVEQLDIEVGSLDDDESTVGPCESFPSDHRWLVTNLRPESHPAFLRVPVRGKAGPMGQAHKELFYNDLGEDTFCDARVASYLWSLSHEELMTLTESPLQLQRPATIAAKAEAEAAGVPFVAPGASSGGGFGGSGCRICGQNGHYARECPNKDSGAAAASSGAPPRASTATGSPSSPAGAGAAAGGGHGRSGSQRSGGRGVSPPHHSSSSSSGVAPRPPRSLSPAKTQFSKDQLAALAPPRSRSKDAQQPVDKDFKEPRCALDVFGECDGSCHFQHFACRFGTNCTVRACCFGHPKERALPSAADTARPRSPAGTGASAVRLHREFEQGHNSQPPAQREGTSEGPREASVPDKK